MATVPPVPGRTHVLVPHELTSAQLRGLLVKIFPRMVEARCATFPGLYKDKVPWSDSTISVVSSGVLSLLGLPRGQSILDKCFQTHMPDGGDLWVIALKPPAGPRTTHRVRSRRHPEVYVVRISR